MAEEQNANNQAQLLLQNNPEVNFEDIQARIRVIEAEKNLLRAQLVHAEKHNKVLQLEMQIMKNKMGCLESLITKLNENLETKTTIMHVICSSCGLLQLNDSSSATPSQEQNSFTFSDDDEESSQSEENPSKNPLLVDLIVAQILKYIPSKQLFRLRLVHPIWNQEATRLIHQNYQFHFTKTTLSKLELENGFPFSPQNLKLTVDSVLKPYRTPLENMFTTLGSEIKNLSLNCENQHFTRLYSEEVLNLFLANVPYLTTLELSIPIKITEKTALYPPGEKSLSFPFLRRISLSQYEPGGGYSIGFTKDIFQSASNLEEFRIETRTLDVITRILIALQDTPFSRGLSTLELECNLSEIHLEMLNEMSDTVLKNLKVLQLSYFTQQVEPLTLESLLVKHQDKLETLVLSDSKRRGNNAPLFTIRLPPMKNLGKFVVADPCFGQERQLNFSPFNYQTTFPKLRSIVFFHEPGSPSGFQCYRDILYSKCDTVNTIEFHDGIIDAERVLNSVAIMFSNVTKMVAKNLSDDAIRCLWRNMEQIQDLELHFGVHNHDLDSVVTGIPSDVCRKIQENNLFSQINPTSLLTVIRTEESICNLKNLTRLRLDGVSSSSLLTAVSGYLALSLMPQLVCVSIRADIITISNICKKVLKDKLNLAVLEFF